MRASACFRSLLAVDPITARFLQQTTWSGMQVNCRDHRPNTHSFAIGVHHRIERSVSSEDTTYKRCSNELKRRP